MRVFHLERDNCKKLNRWAHPTYLGCLHLHYLESLFVPLFFLPQMLPYCVSQEYVHVGCYVLGGAGINKYPLNYKDNWIHCLLKMVDGEKRAF